MIKTITNYTFNASAKTITFNDYATIDIARVVSVVNVSNGTNNYVNPTSCLAIKMYQPATGDFNYKKASATGNVLTVTCDTSQMTNSDKLQIIYDDPNYSIYDTNGNLKTSDQNLSGAISCGKMLVSEANSADIKSDLDTLSKAVSSNALQVNETNSTFLNNITSIKANTSNIPALGQAVAASSVPVVLPATQAPTLEYKFTGGATSTLNNNIIMVTPGTGLYSFAGFGSFSLQINASSGITAGAITFENSEDGINWVALPLLNLSSGAKVTNFTTAASTSYFFIGSTPFIYFRARISTAILGGTVTCYTRQMPWPMSPNTNYMAI